MLTKLKNGGLQRNDTVSVPLDLAPNPDNIVSGKRNELRTK